jgi:hypothetical protein
MYRIKTKLKLLQLLYKHVKIALINSDVNPNSDGDVMDIILDMKDKKTVKELKLIEKDLKKWISEYEV